MEVEQTMFATHLQYYSIYTITLHYNYIIDCLKSRLLKSLV